MEEMYKLVYLYFGLGFIMLYGIYAITGKLTAVLSCLLRIQELAEQWTYPERYGNKDLYGRTEED